MEERNGVLWRQRIPSSLEPFYIRKIISITFRLTKAVCQGPEWTCWSKEWKTGTMYYFPQTENDATPSAKCNALTPLKHNRLARGQLNGYISTRILRLARLVISLSDRSHYAPAHKGPTHTGSRLARRAVHLLPKAFLHLIYLSRSE